MRTGVQELKEGYFHTPSMFRNEDRAKNKGEVQAAEVERALSSRSFLNRFHSCRIGIIPEGWVLTFRFALNERR
jgi:hypothetical protein